MSPKVAVPLSASWRVASVRMRVDFPAPFGPRSPYIPGPISRETPSSACTPLEYFLDRPRIDSCMDFPGSMDRGTIAYRQLERWVVRRSGGNSVRAAKMDEVFI